MAKYQLTDEQKEILQVASQGLRDESVEQTWNLVAHQDYVLDVYGFPLAKELGLSATDLRVFARQGFLEKVSQDTNKHVYAVHEQTIHDAVESDFEMPDLRSHSANVQANFYAPISGSNVNVAHDMYHISQNVEAIPTLSDTDKAEIDNLISAISEALRPFQESHPSEIRNVTRSIALVVGDLAEEVTDKDNIRGAVARLKHAGAKLIFSTAAQAAVNGLAAFVESLPYVGT